MESEFDFLRERLKLYADMLEQLPDGVIAFDDSMRVTYANRAACLQFGFEASRLIGISLDELIPEKSRVKHRTLVNGFRKCPVARLMGASSEPLQGRNSKGENFPCDIKLGRLHSAAGTLTLAVVRTSLYR